MSATATARALADTTAVDELSRGASFPLALTPFLGRDGGALMWLIEHGHREHIGRKDVEKMNEPQQSADIVEVTGSND